MKKFLLCCILFFSFSSFYGQVQFIERTVIDNTSNTEGAKSAFSIDLDGDGDKDVITASYEDNKIAWYENLDGLGSFGQQQVVSANALGASKVFAIDLDLDGDADLLSASELDNTIAWYENTNGLGAFGTKRIITILADGTQSVFAADLDGDGDIDVLSASKDDNKIAWYENTNGAGAFGEQQIITDQADGARSVYAADLDSDGDMDVLYTNDSDFYDENVAWFENLDGNANFGNLQIVHTSNHKHPREVMAEDMNGDGHVDIIFSTGSAISWYKNIDGTGNFDYEHKVPGSLSGGSFFPKDINADGLIDIVGASAYDDKVVWYRATFHGSFASEEVISNKVQQPEAVLTEDFDNDGKIDVLSASAVDDKVVWFQNIDGQGTFSLQKSISRNAMSAKKVYPTDIDGDGDIDLLVVSGLDSKISWFENTDGQGTFGLQNVITNSRYGASSAYPFDADGDGDIDIMASGRYRALGWYENIDGKGNFTDGTFYFKHFIDSPDANSELYADDIDNDGFIDVVAAIDQTHPNGKLGWYRNLDGTGQFGGFQTIQATGVAFTISVADFNGDTNLDVLKTSYFDDVIMWMENTGNTGFNRFNPANIIIDGAETKRAIASKPIDIDGDGDLDIISAHSWLYNDDRIYWHENTDGMGNFVLGGTISQTSKGIKAIFSADLDGDGDNDVLAASSSDSSVKWYENFNGVGGFANVHLLTDSADGATDVKAADINGDGKIDVIASSSSDGKVSWFQNIGLQNPNDSDGDGVLSDQETADNTDPEDGCSYLESSQDIDLISVLWEEADCDNDGILNGTELTNGSNPRNEDSDGDGVLDGDDSNPSDGCLPIQNVEYTGYDSTNTLWQNNDCDLDGVQNGDEIIAGTNPYFNEAIYTDSSYPDTFNEQQIETNGSARSIATNGTTVAVGRRWGSINKVEIYIKNTDGIWGKTQEIQPPNTQGAARFGWTLAMNENTLFVAQPFGIQNQPDTIFLYQKNSNGIWIEIQQIQASSDFMEDGFGSSMDVSGNTIVIGADGIAPAGAVYVFEKNGNNTWVETAEIYPSDELFDGAIGHAVAIADDQIVVGASGYGEHGAFVYQRQIDDSWLEIQQLSAPDNQNYTFARDVSISDNRLIIGDINYSDWPENYNKGRTTIYEKSYGGLWRQVQTLHAENGYVGDYFGDALAMNDNRIIVNLSADQTDVGSLHVFHKSTGYWIETHSLTDPLGFSWNFGTNVAIAPGLIVATSDEYVHFFEDAIAHVDTDGDGLADADDSDPLDACLPVQNADYTDYDVTNTVWTNADCDADGTLNGEELNNGTNPYEYDSSEEACVKITHSDGTNSEYFGGAFAFSDDEQILATTASIDDLGESNRIIYIFNKNTLGEWEETQKLTASDVVADDYFGSSITFAGETLVVGAHRQNHSTGAVYLFDKSPLGVWEESQKLLASDTYYYKYFGNSLSGINNRLIVGSSRDNQFGTASGAAYVFEKNENNEWVESKKLVASDGASHDSFGASVAISNNTIVIGTVYDNNNNVDSNGSAFVFDKQSNGEWIESAKLKPLQTSVDGGFGVNVDIFNNTIVVGNASISSNATTAGAAHVFEKSNDGSWSQVIKLSATNPKPKDLFGFNVKINKSYIACSSSSDDENGPYSGSVQLFSKSNAEDWSPAQKLFACDPPENHLLFGKGIDMSDNSLVANISVQGNSKMAFVYDLEQPAIDHLTLDVNSKSISCSGANDATVTAAATGGTPPYLFILETPALGNTSANRTGLFENISAGDYIVTVSDDLGVEVSQPISILEVEPLNITATDLKYECENQSNGSLNLEAQGGSAPYQFSIDSGASFQSSSVFENLVAGTYIAAVRDTNGCQVDMTFVIEQGINIEPEINVTEASCDNTDGSITINIANPGEYLFSIVENADISEFSLSNTFNLLESGTYTVSVAHISGCIKEQTVIIESKACSDFTLPVNNFTIETTGESCASSNNGSILLRAEENLDYTATLVGGIANEAKEFRIFTNFNDLEAGSFELCITVAGEDGYNKCFTITITEPGELGVDSNLDESGKSISLNLQGGAKYYINLNGTEYSTSENHITIPLSKIENNITVKTDKACQGVYEKTVMANYNSLSIYPNPVEKGDVNIVLPNDSSKEVLLTVFSENGIRVLEKMEKPVNKTVQMNMDGLPSGVYTIIITTASQNSMRKIIKK